MGELIEFEGKARRPELRVERGICDHLAIALARLLGTGQEASGVEQESGEEQGGEASNGDGHAQAWEALERYRRLREHQKQRMPVERRGRPPRGPVEP